MNLVNKSLDSATALAIAAPGRPKLIEDVHLNAGQQGLFFDFYLDAQENERLRMGRELHDSTGQLLLALSLNLACLRQTGRGEQAGIIQEINDTVGEIDREIRTFAFIHYPADLDDRGLVAALASLTGGFARRTGLRASFHGSCSRPISSPVALAFLRVAQEALTNVHRHAGATTARVTLAEDEHGLELTIKDNGKGKVPVAGGMGGGIGIPGMRHRIEKLGGQFSVRRLKSGTRIVASVPLDQAAPVAALVTTAG